MSNLEVVKKSLATFDTNQVQLYKDNFCKGATDDELLFFMQYCKQTGLDPVKKQIYCIARWDKKLGRNLYVPQPSVEGFRAIAERSGKYEGQVGPFWCGKDGKWTDIWTESTSPYAAKVGVYRSGCREPIWGIAKYEAYVQKFYKDGKWEVGKFWQGAGADNQLAKCAESLALRKAFSNDGLAGTYSKEEMEQASNEEQRNELGQQNDRTDNTISKGSESDSSKSPDRSQNRSDALNERLKSTSVATQLPKKDNSEPTWDQYQAKKKPGPIAKEAKPIEVNKDTGEVTGYPELESFDKFEQEKLPVLEMPEKEEKRPNHWDALASAGKYAGKTMRDISKIVGKDGMIRLYETSLEKVNTMATQKKEVPQSVRETISNLELCINEL